MEKMIVTYCGFCHEAIYEGEKYLILKGRGHVHVHCYEARLRGSSSSSSNPLVRDYPIHVVPVPVKIRKILFTWALPDGYWVEDVEGKVWFQSKPEIVLPVDLKKEVMEKAGLWVTLREPIEIHSYALKRVPTPAEIAEAEREITRLEESYRGPELRRRLGGIREGDVGVLTESMMADDTAGRSHRIPVGMEVKIVRVEPTFISFYTGDVIEGENFFVTPLTLEFKRKFRKGAVPMGGSHEKIYWRDIPEGASVDLIGREYYYKDKLVFWHGHEAAEAQRALEGMRRHIASSTVCPVCSNPVVGGPDDYLTHIRIHHPEEWRKLETDPTYTLRKVERKAAELKHLSRELLEKVGGGAEAGIIRCQYCGAPYLYRENLEIHEAGCPKRMAPTVPIPRIRPYSKEERELVEREVTRVAKKYTLSRENLLADVADDMSQKHFYVGAPFTEDHYIDFIERRARRI